MTSATTCKSQFPPAQANVGYSAPTRLSARRERRSRLPSDPPKLLHETTLIPAMQRASPATAHIPLSGSEGQASHLIAPYQVPMGSPPWLGLGVRGPPRLYSQCLKAVWQRVRESLVCLVLEFAVKKRKIDLCS